VFLGEPKTQILLLDGNGSLSCQAMALHSQSPIQIYWMKDHGSLPEYMVPQVANFERILTPNETVEVNSVLHLVNVTWQDVGRYQCIAQNHLGIIYSSKANVTVHSKLSRSLYFRIVPQDFKSLSSSHLFHLSLPKLCEETFKRNSSSGTYCQVRVWGEGVSTPRNSIPERRRRERSSGIGQAVSRHAQR
jgi:hypothetical protein